MMRILRILAPNPGVRELEGTNTWVVGRWPAAVIDPGPDNPDHLHEVVEAAGRVELVLLTHDHPDHAPGAPALAALTGAPVRSWRGEGTEHLRDGQIVAMPGVHLQVVATPGHTPDHVSFLGPEDGSLFTGDMVLGRGTSVIDPPEGDLAVYLRSLTRMRELGPRTIYPGHGPIVLDAVSKLDEYLEHRAMREEQVLAAMKDGLATPEEMVPAIYGDSPAEVHELAARSVLAHLLKLEAEGRAQKRKRDGVARWKISEPRSCERCGRPVKGRSRLCPSCSVAVLQERD
jgi:glyoxylase-like metal-dependent hydrolase (beta-lactamase superfamily II)